MWTRLFIMTAVGLGLLSASPTSSQTLPEDPVSQARAMAFSGKRDDALRVLTEYLDTYPDDTDARTLFGTVLSWQGEYEEARVQLQTVLDGNPTHGDALPALVNVELWSDHPERAASMAAVGLAENPTSSALLVTRARALWNLSREHE